MAMQIEHLSQPVTARDHAGSLDAPVTLVEYGDFECPFCGMAYGEIKDIRQRLGDRLRFVYHHFRDPSTFTRATLLKRQKPLPRAGMLMPDA